MQMDGVHPHAVGHVGPVGGHGMPVHGAGPDGEHPPHAGGPRRRYQNRTKPNNNIERLPLDEAAKRVCNFLNRCSCSFSSFPYFTTWYSNKKKTIYCCLQIIITRIF